MAHEGCCLTAQDGCFWRNSISHNLKFLSAIEVSFSKKAISHNKSFFQQWNLIWGETSHLSHQPFCVRSRQNGVFFFVKINRLYKNGFIPPRWDLISMQVRPHLGGMIFFYVNSFCWAVPPRRDCLFKTRCVFIIITSKNVIFLVNFSSVDVLLVIQNWDKNKKNKQSIKIT